MANDVITKPMIYTIGYQPIELIDVDFTIVDIINLITSDKKAEDVNLRVDIIKFLEDNRKLFNDNYLLVNSKLNRTFLPYCVFRKSIVFDQPYVPHRYETEYLLNKIQSIIGVTETINKEKLLTTTGAYHNSLNTLRSQIFNNSENLSPGDYFNALMLLSDMNRCDKSGLTGYINKNAKFAFNRSKEYKYVMYFGDPVNPEFFNKLLEKNYIVVNYLPYDQYLTPCDDIGEYYASNFLFQTPFFNVITLRNLINNFQTEHGGELNCVLINPGSVFLNREEAAYYMGALANDIKFKLVTGFNPNVADLGLD